MNKNCQKLRRHIITQSGFIFLVRQQIKVILMCT